MKAIINGFLINMGRLLAIEFKHQKANVPKTNFITVNNQMNLHEPKEFCNIYMTIQFIIEDDSQSSCQPESDSTGLPYEYRY